MIWLRVPFVHSDGQSKYLGHLMQHMYSEAKSLSLVWEPYQAGKMIGSVYKSALKNRGGFGSERMPVYNAGSWKEWVSGWMP